MTEPIRNKFEGLDESLAQRHNLLMDKMQEILENIEAPPDYSSTLAAQVTALEDVVSKLITANTLLLNTFNALDTYSAADALRWAAMAEQLGRLTTLDDNIQQVQNTIGLHTGGTEFTLASLTRAILTAMNSIYGVVSPMGGVWPVSVLAALECICDGITTLQPVTPLDPRANPPCDNPFASTGQYIVPALAIGVGGNINVATFTGPLPAGLSFGTVFGIGVDYSELNSADWSQWAVYVQSGEEQYADTPLTFERWPTNQWRLLSGSGSKAFSVSERGAIKVLLCYISPYDLPEGDCITVNADTSIGGNQAWVIPTDIPDTYTITTLDNFYMRNADLIQVSGPYGAGTPHTVGSLRVSGGAVLRFGYSTSDPTVTVQVCNPEPV